jgi:serine/threonine-protein kinase
MGNTEKEPSLSDILAASGDPGSPFNGELDLTGKTLADYRVLRLLGKGGMGQVYLAEQLSLKRNVALKIMRADLAANATALARFKAEAEAVARVPHSNIVQVYQVGVVDGLHFMALEFVDGRNLRDYLAKKGPPDLPVALSLMRQAAAALQRAHEAGIVHRDIKPENMLLTRKGELKIADFGLSRCLAPDQPAPNLTQSGVAMGTPLYMSPEQVQGKPVDPRTDIYSFGVTCFHMLAGHPPFRGESTFEIALQHVQNEAPPLADVRPDLPPELCDVIHKMMAKAPDDRYQTCKDLLRDLAGLRERLAGGATQPVAPARPQTQLRQTKAKTKVLAPKPAPKRFRWVLPMVAMLLALVVGAALHIWQMSRAAMLPVVVEPPPEPSAAAVRDKELLTAFQKDYDPADSDAVRKHVQDGVHLAVAYLEQRRLDEATSFFKSLIDKPQSPKIDVALGKIGMATTLAFQDQARPSVAQFMDLEKAKPPEKFRQFNPKMVKDYPEFFLLHHPLLRWQVSEALTRDAANLGEPLPSDLESLRRLPALPPARP